MTQIEPSPAGLAHDAFFYRGVEDYARTIVAFVRQPPGAGSPTLIAVPKPRAGLLRALLVGGSQEITFADMNELGRNPARIIAALRRFLHAHPHTSVRFVGETVWPGRNPAELAEASLHESLLPAAVTGRNVSILCPHDAEALDPEVLDTARRTHSHVGEGGGRQASQSFDPDLAAQIARQQLPAAPPDCCTLVFYDAGLHGVRRFVEEAAGQPGFTPLRLDDLLLAVTEVATNTLVHSGGPGTIRLWRDADAGELICDVSDAGRITDPLAGRSGPYPVAQRGWGLWMVNQVCDLVELRSGDWGSNVRLHMRLEDP